MNDFMTWDVLTQYATFVTVVFMVVEFTKELPYIIKLPTKYYSFIVAFILIVITQLQFKTFVPIGIVLYALSAISVSLGSNGLSNFTDKEV